MVLIFLHRFLVSQRRLKHRPTCSPGANDERFSIKCPRTLTDRSILLTLLNDPKEFFRSTLNRRRIRRGRATGCVIVSRSLFLSQNSKISSNIFGILCNGRENNLHRLTSDNQLFILILRQVSGYSRTGL